MSSKNNGISVSLDSQVSYYTHYIDNRDNWTFVPHGYSSFQERDRRNKEAERAAVKAEYLRGPEVKALIKF